MSRKIEYLEELQIAIRFKHLCQPIHQESVFVHEMTRRGETAWEGYVEVFGLTGHRNAKTCYAWLNHKNNGIEILTVLGNHFVDSAQRAVQAAIFMDAQAAFSSDRALFRDQLELLKKTLQDTQIKSEDLNTTIEAAQQFKEAPSPKKRA